MSDGDHIEIHAAITHKDLVIIQGQSGLKDGTLVRTTLEKPKAKKDNSKGKKQKRHSARHQP